MTTSRRTVRRERAREWPMFRDLSLPGDSGVLAVEITRAPHERISSAVAETATALADAWSGVPVELRQLALVAVGQAIDPSSKVAAYNAERDKIWAALERTGLAVPEGPRLESRIDYRDGTHGFIGLIKLATSGISEAVEVTRRENAVCVGVAELKPESLIGDIADSLLATAQDPDALLKLFMPRLDRGALVVRGFGEFDDRVVGVEVFASASVLDGIEAALDAGYSST